MTDDLLWLAFVTGSYIRETGRLDILQDQAPFLDEDAKSLFDHIMRRSRGLRADQRTRAPYIGAGDWNDGLSAVGLEERGESVWLAHFLAGLLADWTVVCERTGGARSR